MAVDKYDMKRRRASNIVWTAAGKYNYQPDFLAFKENGKPDLYLNAVIGLTDKYYDMKKLNAFFDELNEAAMRDIFMDLMWLGLENAVYQKESPVRPVLSILRKDHAKEYFQTSLMNRHGVAQDMQAARWHEVLGEPTGLLDPWGKKLYATLNFSPDLTTDEIIEKFQDIMHSYFLSRHLVRESLEKVIISDKLADFISLFVPTFTKRQESIFNVRQATKQAQDELEGKKAWDSPMEIITGTTAAKNYAYVVKCFGQPMYNPLKMLEINRELCTGAHKLCHLYFTRGGSQTSAIGGGAPSYLALAAKQQRIKNLAFYKEHNELYRKSIAKLKVKIANSLEITSQRLEVPSKTGTFNAGSVWRALYLHDPRVFYGKEETLSPDFTVDLMLDASASRGGSQRVIAAQAYTISESLRQCGIPFQVFSFCSLRGYTVLNLFKSYTENKSAANVFNYCATGWNRDGLALRGARELMGEGTGVKRILIMFTDAAPNDDRSMTSDNNNFARHDYSESRAVADTAAEVDALKQEGIKVIGLINDETNGSLTSAKKIFGKDYVRIKHLDKMADSIGDLLCGQIKALKDN
jgi:hypothetical protein